MLLDDYVTAYLFHHEKGIDWHRLVRAATSAGRLELVDAAEAARDAHDSAAQLWAELAERRFGVEVFRDRADALDGGRLGGGDLDAAVAGLAKRVAPEGV